MPKTIASLPAQVKKTSDRIFTLDLLRGYFLCVILINHLGFTPNGLSLLTGRGFLYASTAEGFFAVSGIILGIVRGRKLLGKPLREATKLLWKRALQLYITSIILTVFFTLVGQFFLNDPGLKSGIFTDWSSWWIYAGDVLTLRYTYGWADFLRYYAIFLFFAPLALWLLRKGYWHLLVGGSLAVWCVYVLLPLQGGLYQPVSWQVIFFLSFAIGYYWGPLLRRWRQLPVALQRSIKYSTVSLFIITLAASFVLVFGARITSPTGEHLLQLHTQVEQHFEKDRMPIERILLGTVWFWGLFIIVRRHETFLMKKVGWLFYRLGANSLYVYTLSAFVVFFAHLFLVPPPGFETLAFNLLASVGAVGLVWFALRMNFLTKLIPR